MTEPKTTLQAVEEVLSRAKTKDVIYLNAQSANRVRSGLVFGMLILFAFTVAGACIGAFFGSASRWSQMSPVIDTVLAIEAAALGSAIAFYMAKQD